MSTSPCPLCGDEMVADSPTSRPMANKYVDPWIETTCAACFYAMKWQVLDRLKAALENPTSSASDQALIDQMVNDPNLLDNRKKDA